MKNAGILVTIILLISSFFAEEENIVRMNTPAINSTVKEIIPFIADINDTIPNDTLFTYLDSEGFPIKYSRKIITGVCIKGECRLVNLELFWNITGSYLGFKLPAGEFLSKTEHVKFTNSEYDQLHILLNDPQSALASYSLEELVPVKDTAEQKVDAVSSATIAAVLEYIVEGAVYTTYTLWHIVHGPTKREIEKRTTEILNSQIIIKLLESESLSEKVWVLNHISEKVEISAEVQQKLMEQISGKDIYLAERSLNALKKEAITNEIQLELVKIFNRSGFLQKRLIIQKLKEVTILNENVVQILSSEIGSLNGTLVKLVLELFEIHKTENEQVASQVSSLLKNDNRYIANQAYNYLKNTKTMDKKTLKSFEKYKKKNL